MTFKPDALTKAFIIHVAEPAQPATPTFETSRNIQKYWQSNATGNHISSFTSWLARAGNPEINRIVKMAV